MGNLYFKKDLSREVYASMPGLFWKFCSALSCRVSAFLSEHLSSSVQHPHFEEMPPAEEKPGSQFWQTSVYIKTPYLGPPMQLNAGVLSWKSEGNCREIPGRMRSGEPPLKGERPSILLQLMLQPDWPPAQQTIKANTGRFASIPEPAVRGFHRVQNQQWPLKHCW